MTACHGTALPRRRTPPGAPLRRIRVRAFGLATAALLLAGCSASVLDGTVQDAARGEPAGGVATAGSPAPGSTTPDPVDRLHTSLLGSGDLGPGWTDGAPPVPDPAAPSTCGGPGTVARFPDALRLGSTVDGAPGFVVQEALSVYRDLATAQAAFAAGAAGLACAHGSLHGAAVDVTATGDLRTDVGGDQASGWHVGSASLDAVLVLVQARQAVFAFAYVTPAGTADTARPDPRALSRVAVARALAA